MWIWFERLLALVIGAAHASGAARTTDRVELVDEDDRGSIRLCLLE
jgi:hypothetical protein